MKIVLTAINAKYIHSNPAVYALRAAAGEYRENIDIAEFTINHQKDEILREIYRRKPDVLCFSCYIWNLNIVEEIAAEFHQLCPDVPVWAGGPEVSYETERFLNEHPAIYGIMIGEGEETFLELCRYYLQNEDTAGRNRLENIKGLALRTAAGIRKTGERPAACFGELPFFYEDTEAFANRILYYESSRGCPFSCSYCLSSVEKKLRFKDPERVCRELQFFLDRKVRQVKFVDRTFNCNHEHALQIWRYIREHDNGITNFHFEIAADLLNEEELELLAMMRPGLIQLEIGVQSTNPETIREIHRTMDLDKLKTAVERIRSGRNIHQHLDLIAGLPLEDYESFRRSFNEIYALQPQQLQLGFLKVLKGSYLYEHAAEYGILYHQKPPYEVLQTNVLSYEDICRIKRVEEMLEVYGNSGQYQVTMRIMRLLCKDSFDFFQRLGDFYEEKGYLLQAHSRMQRSEILLEFLTGEAARLSALRKEKLRTDLAELWREALVLDLYFRENCKTRPSFAPESEERREKNRRYCRNGKLSHVEAFSYRFLEEDGGLCKELPVRLQEKVWLYFDYTQRDLPDHQAKVAYLREAEESFGK